MREARRGKRGEGRGRGKEGEGKEGGERERRNGREVRKEMEREGIIQRDRRDR